MTKVNLGRDSALDIVAERRNQIFTHGHDPEHDDKHANGELLRAALAYMCVPGEFVWPFPHGFNPSEDPIENLIVAGAFVAAEADRLKRLRRNGHPAVAGMIVLAPHPDDIERAVKELREVVDE